MYFLSQYYYSSAFKYSMRIIDDISANMGLLLDFSEKDCA